MEQRKFFAEGYTEKWQRQQSNPSSLLALEKNSAIFKFVKLLQSTNFYYFLIKRIRLHMAILFI